MVDLEYWVQTFLSTRVEIIVLGISTIIAAFVAVYFPDRRDYTAAVFVGVLVPTGVSIYDPLALQEWHYWVGGALASVALVILVDRRNSDPLFGV